MNMQDHFDRLQGLYGVNDATLSNFSYDALYTVKEAVVVETIADLEFVEFLQRLMDQRVDGWFYGRASDILTDADLSVLAGAGAIAFDLTDPANPIIKYTENVVPNGAMECKISPPTNYVIEPLDASMRVSASAATYVLSLNHGNGLALAHLISELLNTVKFWRSETNQWGNEIAVSGNSYLGLTSSVEMGANVTLEVPLSLRWRRLSTWVARA